MCDFCRAQTDDLTAEDISEHDQMYAEIRNRLRNLIVAWPALTDTTRTETIARIRFMDSIHPRFEHGTLPVVMWLRQVSPEYFERYEIMEWLLMMAVKTLGELNPDELPTDLRPTEADETVRGYLRRLAAEGDPDSEESDAGYLEWFGKTFGSQ